MAAPVVAMLPLLPRLSVAAVVRVLPGGPGGLLPLPGGPGGLPVLSVLVARVILRLVSSSARRLGPAVTGAVGGVSS